MYQVKIRNNFFKDNDGTTIVFLSWAQAYAVVLTSLNAGIPASVVSYGAKREAKDTEN